jgi:hypothetical protein
MRIKSRKTYGQTRTLPRQLPHAIRYVNRTKSLILYSLGTGRQAQPDWITNQGWNSGTWQPLILCRLPLQLPSSSINVPISKIKLLNCSCNICLQATKKHTDTATATDADRRTHTHTHTQKYTDTDKQTRTHTDTHTHAHALASTCNSGRKLKYLFDTSLPQAGNPAERPW